MYKTVVLKKARLQYVFDYLPAYTSINGTIISDNSKVAISLIKEQPFRLYKTDMNIMTDFRAHGNCSLSLIGKFTEPVILDCRITMLVS